MRTRRLGPFPKGFGHAKRFAHAISDDIIIRLERALQQRHGRGQLISVQQKEAELRCRKRVSLVLLRYCSELGFGGVPIPHFEEEVREFSTERNVGRIEPERCLEFINVRISGGQKLTSSFGRAGLSAARSRK